MPHLGVLRNVFAQAMPRPSVPYYSRMSEILQRTINSALAGETEPEGAMEEAQAEIEEIVNHYREDSAR
jgi:multiple sugar transport system substrate-binding protein